LQSIDRFGQGASTGSQEKGTSQKILKQYLTDNVDGLGGVEGTMYGSERKKKAG
jgi:hypothetical protein